MRQENHPQIEMLTADRHACVEGLQVDIAFYWAIWRQMYLFLLVIASKRPLITFGVLSYSTSFTIHDISAFSHLCQSHDPVYTHQSHASIVFLHLKSSLFPHFKIIVRSIMSCLCLLYFQSAHAYISAGALFISCRKESLLFRRCILIHAPLSVCVQHMDRESMGVSKRNKERNEMKGKTSNQFLKPALCVGYCRKDFTTQGF